MTQGLLFVKERRYVAKILTVLLRDYPKVLTGGSKDRTILRPLSVKVWELSLKNLTYLLPFYIGNVIMPDQNSL